MSTTPKAELSAALTTELYAAMNVDFLHEPFIDTIAAALRSYEWCRDYVAMFRDAPAIADDFLKLAKAMTKVLSPRSITLLELARQPDTPVLFQPIRDHLARAIAALSDEKSWLNAGRTSRNRKQAARKVLRFAVLTALDEQTSIKMWLPTAGRGPAGAVLKAVMREADRLDSRPPRARDAEIKLADWNRWIREWDQRERPEERF